MIAILMGMLVPLASTSAQQGGSVTVDSHLCPDDWGDEGIGPEQLGVRELEGLLQEGQVRELILATNPTVEGEATAHFLSELAARRGVRASRIAHGVPMGGELEYVDGGTLAHALAGRQLFG